MSRPAGDPFAQQSRFQRWVLRRRLRRAWRVGRAERHAATLDALQPVVGADTVVAVTMDGTQAGAVTEVVFTSGLRARLALCHRPVVTALARRSAEGRVVLDRAADHGRCWGLYFTSAAGRIPLLASDVTVSGGPPGGFGRRPAAELSPA